MFVEISGSGQGIPPSIFVQGNSRKRGETSHGCASGVFCFEAMFGGRSQELVFPHTCVDAALLFRLWIGNASR